MDFFLLLTALLCSLTGVNRSAEAPVRVVAAARSTSTAEAVLQVTPRVAAPRPDGYVAPAPAVLDLAMARGFALPVAPERRRE